MRTWQITAPVDEYYRSAEPLNSHRFASNKAINHAENTLYDWGWLLVVQAKCYRNMLMRGGGGSCLKCEAILIHGLAAIWQKRTRVTSNEQPVCGHVEWKWAPTRSPTWHVLNAAICALTVDHTRWKSERSAHNQKTNMINDKLVLINNRSLWLHPQSSHFCLHSVFFALSLSLYLPAIAHLILRKHGCCG